MTAERMAIHRRWQQRLDRSPHRIRHFRLEREHDD
jgi:hypothetical protein